VGYLPPLHPFSDGINGQSEIPGSLVYGHTPSGPRHCAVLSHEGYARLSVPVAKA
jgi:hypothetical protein